MQRYFLNNHSISSGMSAIITGDDAHHIVTCHAYGSQVIKLLYVMKIKRVTLQPLQP